MRGCRAEHLNLSHARRLDALLSHARANPPLGHLANQQSHQGVVPRERDDERVRGREGEHALLDQESLRRRALPLRVVDRARERDGLPGSPRARIPPARRRRLVPRELHERGRRGAELVAIPQRFAHLPRAGPDRSVPGGRPGRARVRRHLRELKRVPVRGDRAQVEHAPGAAAERANDELHLGVAEFLKHVVGAVDDGQRRRLRSLAQELVEVHGSSCRGVKKIP